MSRSAKIDLAPSHAIDGEVRDEMEKNETTKALEHKPDPVHRADAEILDDELSFVRSEN